jgi:hypothetical protein
MAFRFDQPFFGANNVIGAEDGFSVFAMGANFFDIFGKDHNMLL